MTPLDTNDLSLKQLISKVEPNRSPEFNPSQSITEATIGDVTTTTMVKTIGTSTYTKTISVNNSTGAVTISSWS